MRSRAMLIAAAAGFVICAFGLFFEPRTMLVSYLAAWTAVSAVPIGAIAVLATTYLVRGGWTQDLNRLLATTALTVPMMALLFIPVLAGLSLIYPWAAGTTDLPWFKAAYLAPWFFVARTLVYFAIWSALAVWLWQVYGDDVGMKRSASVSLIVWALVSSWAGIDWIESVEPDFHSSIYSLLTIGFQLLAGFGFALFMLLLANRPRRMANTAYAGVLLATLLLWAYLHAMQYIIIWTGNIPDETVWYIERLEGGWGFALWALFILQFIVPFFALLSESIRGNTRALLWVAGITLAMRYLEAVVLILPPLHAANLWLLLDLPAALLAIGPTSLFAWQFAERLWQMALSRRAPTPG
jgi:hypothetical protein